MNFLTAVFLQQLYTYAPQKEELMQLARRELLRELDCSMPDAISPGTLFCTAQGQQLKREITEWKTKVEHCSRMEDVIRGLRSLQKLKDREERFHEETQREIRNPGFVDSARLHVFYHREQGEALRILNEVIHVELFRIVCLGGVRRFSRIPPLARVPDSLVERLAYYKDYLIPSITDLEENALYGYWAIRYQPDSRTGPRGKLPAYSIAEPKNSKGKQLLPGEYQKIPIVQGTLYQGIGCLTNLTPDTVERAQNMQVHDQIPVVELSSRLYRLDPIQALASYFRQEFYAVDAYELFAAADVAQSANTLMERGQTESCFLCGSAVKNNAPLCSSCVEKVYVK